MFWLTIAAGAGFALARTLLVREDAAAALPQPLREPTQRATTRLRAARARVREAIDAASDETARAERELTTEYRIRAGREPAPPPPDPRGSARVAFERPRRL